MKKQLLKAVQIFQCMECLLCTCFYSSEALLQIYNTNKIEKYTNMYPAMQNYRFFIHKHLFSERGLAQQMSYLLDFQNILVSYQGIEHLSITR